VPRVDLRVLVAGFEGAHARILAARFPEPRNDATFHALLEILAWVGAIRDRCKDEGLPKPDVLEGLYYPRNVVIHQGADVLAWAIGGGVGGPLGSYALGAVPMRAALHWPLRDDMPRPRQKTGGAQYDVNVADRGLYLVLGALKEELEPLVGL